MGIEGGLGNKQSDRHFPVPMDELRDAFLSPARPDLRAAFAKARTRLSWSRPARVSPGFVKVSPSDESLFEGERAHNPLLGARVALSGSRASLSVCEGLQVPPSSARSLSPGEWSYGSDGSRSRAGSTGSGCVRFALPPESASPSSAPPRPMCFTGMAAPYTLTLGGETGALSVRHSNRAGAKVLLARRASARDPHAAPRTSRPPIRRQKTEDHSRREASPYEDPLSASPPTHHSAVRPTLNTHVYVRRGSSNDFGEDVKLTEAKSRKERQRRLPKLSDNMKDLLELFTAVEQDDIGKVRSMLQKGFLDVNGENLEDVTLLDVATMLNHAEVAQLLLSKGAQENPRYASKQSRERKLGGLRENAERRLAQIRLALAQPSAAAAPGLQGLSLKELERQAALWESRLHLINKMRLNFDAADPPPPPRNPGLSVASASALLLTLEPSTTPPTPAASPVTKYLVEWSESASFEKVDGSLVVRDLRRAEVTIPNLVSGTPVFVRISAGNFKGFGAPALSHPPSAAPSSWREASGESSRSDAAAIRRLYTEVKAMRESAAWERLFPADVPVVPGKKKKNSLRNLFSASTKFQKTLKKGVYLATVLYKEDKILCTVDETLPIVLVDENAPNSVAADFNWLMKISCGWEDAGWVTGAGEVGSGLGGETLAFRSRLLDAAQEMQSALGVQDLGRLHSKPIQQGGTTIFLTTAYVGDAKAVTGLAVRWTGLPKLLRRHQAAVSGKVERSAYETLVGGLLDQLNFYESTYIPLDKGLYVAYLKLHASINDGISITVPENLPSVLPFVFLRPNAHVSKEEWDWLSSLAKDGNCARKPSPAQLSFHWGLCSAAKILLDDLEVGATAESHRLYRVEVVEVHPEVSFILIVPSAADVVSGPSQGPEKESDAVEERRGCLSIPVPVFEMAHLCTYQPEFISIYCRLSAFLDFFLLVLGQLSRQAFSEAETGACRAQLDALTSAQGRLEDIWRQARWISTVTSRSRERSPEADACLPLSALFSYSPSPGPARLLGTAEEEPHPCEDQGSDVGYHSDQSNGDKRAAAAALLQRAPEPTPPPPDPSQDVVETDGALPTTSTPPTKPPRLELLPQTSTTPVVHAGTKTFLQPLSVQKRFSTASVNSQLLDNRSEPRLMDKLCEASTSSSSSTQSDVESQHSLYSTPPSTARLTMDSRTGHVSDTELLSRFRADAARSPRRQPGRPFDQSTPRAKNLEDLSHIDQLYATFAANRQASPIPSSLAVSPAPSPVRVASPSTVSTNSARSVDNRASPLAGGVLRVYAAYACGLARGTSVKLQATPRTTSREVVALVVQQLGRAAAAKGTEADGGVVGDFVLVAVIGSRERCLRDDFAPLELQNPWAKGKLFVRRKEDLLAALEYGNEAQV